MPAAKTEEQDLKTELEKAMEDDGGEGQTTEAADVSGESERGEAAAAEAAPQLAPQTQTPAWRSVASEMGLNIPEGSDEKEIFKRVFGDAIRYHQSGRQAEQYMQERLPYESEWQAWQTQKQREQEAKAKAESGKPWHDKFWQPPTQYDPAFETVGVDPSTGELTAPKDSAPDLLHRFRQYANFDRTVKRDFFRNPFEYMRGAVEHIARDLFENEFSKRSALQKDEAFANSIVSDPKMQERLIVRDATGRASYTPWGAQYYGALQQACQWNMPTEAQHQYATAMADAWERQSGVKPTNGSAGGASASKPKTKRQQANDDLYGQHEPQVGGQIPGAAETPTPRKKRETSKDDPRELLAAAVKDYTDDDFTNYVQTIGKA